MKKVGNPFKVARSLKLTVILTIIFTLCTSLFIPNEHVNAATTKKVSATVTSAKLNVRSGAGTKYKVVGYLKKGAKVTVYAKKKTGWSEIRFKSKKAYVSTKYLKVANKKITVTRPTYKNINELAQKIRKETGAKVSVDSGSLVVMSSSGPVLAFSLKKEYVLGKRYALLSRGVPGNEGICAKALSIITGESRSSLESALKKFVSNRRTINAGGVTFEWIANTPMALW